MEAEFQSAVVSQVLMIFDLRITIHDRKPAHVYVSHSFILGVQLLQRVVRLPRIALREAFL
jgi:hypothetical protein